MKQYLSHSSLSLTISPYDSAHYMLTLIFPVLQEVCGNYRSFSTTNGAIVLHIIK